MKMAYLDNAATMIKHPEAVKAEAEFYAEINANPLRGLYKKSVQATTGVEEARKRVLELVGADKLYTVIFSRGTTEAINLLANGLIRGDDGFGILDPDMDKIVVDIESHHSNILPWNQRYRNTRIAKNLPKDNWKSEEFSDVKLFSFTGVSNVTGEDLSWRAKMARMSAPEAIIGLDGAQMVGHVKMDITALGVDFVAFSGHKFGAPMGIGGLVIKKSIAEKLRPFSFGGEMVDGVSIDGEPTFSDIPSRLEGGTLNTGAIFGLKMAAEIAKKHLDNFKNGESGLEWINRLRQMATDELLKIPNVEILASNGTILTFNVKDVHPHDTAQILADMGVEIRSGFLCAEPFLKFRGWGPVVRASFSEYNTERDAKMLVSAVKVVRKKMGLKDAI